MLPNNPKIAFAGSVNSSRVTLEKLIEHGMNLVLALGLNPLSSKNVSGFNDLKPVANNGGVNFRYFNKLSETWITEELINLQVDLFFVVGLSQLVRPKLLSIPKYGCIGYHPTMLPKGRGRAAIAWILLGKAIPAVTFFRLDEGADSGPIISQTRVEIQGNEYPQELIDKIVTTIAFALDEMLPKLKKGDLNFKEQNHMDATYLGKRTPKDGYIDWNHSSSEIELLIRSVSRPLPGAFTYMGENKLIIWKCKVIKGFHYYGTIGSVVKKCSDSFIIQTRKGHIKVVEFEGMLFKDIREGMKLGIDFIEMYNSLINN